MRNTLAGLMCLTVVAHAASTVTIDHLPTDQATPSFQFARVPRPVRNDAAAGGSFTIVTGERDPNGASVAILNDGLLPVGEDEPGANFFFRAGSEGGRLLLDLKTSMSIAQVNTYSWHPGGRGPQVYTVYASDGQNPGFNPRPAAGRDPSTCGWTLLATVDSRPEPDDTGGQYGVGILMPTNVPVACLYLLFDIARTSATDPFGHTFFSEIDVIAPNHTHLEFIESAIPGVAPETFTFQDGLYTVVIDTTETPDLADWTRAEIVPMVFHWYPKLIALLPSDGFSPPVRFSIRFDPDMRGVAATSGTRIRCAAAWIRANLEGEAKGAIFHEMVHVLQQYGRARGANRSPRPPGWLVEGLTDYIRWYLFEPESRGAEISARNLDRARYDGSYRITANFLNWVCGQQGEDFIPKLNAAIREGRYSEDLWTELTGRSVQDLGAAWKTQIEKQVASTTAAEANAER